MKNCFLMLISFFCLGCQSEPKSLQKFVGFSMGTSYNIQCVTTQDQRKAIGMRVKKLLKAFNKEMSNWDKESWVSKFNLAKANEKFTIPEHSRDILKQCIQLHKDSDGAFDITISPILEAWGFGGKNKERKIPSDSFIQSLKPYIGSEKLKHLADTHQISKEHDKLEINCSALAKGYAVDLIAEIFENEFKIESYLVEIGGEIRVKGHPPTKKAWTLAVKTPSLKGESKPYIKMLQTTSGSLATSGDYENYFTVDRKRFQHIFDPRTGKPVTHQLSSVSIFGPKCSLTDGLATACLVLGVEESKKLLKKYPSYHAYFVERLADGTFKESHTGGFSQASGEIKR